MFDAALDRAHPILVLTLVFLAPTAFAGDAELQLGAGDDFVIKNDGGVIDRLRVAEDTGNISRNGALFVHTSGTDNTFVGEGAGNASTTSTGGVAIGKNALGAVTSGDGNAAIGKDVLTATTIGGFNVAIGLDAMKTNTEGIRNSAIGVGALFDNTTGAWNTAIGSNAMVNNTDGGQNVAIGGLALDSNTSGTGNVAIGYLAGDDQTTGSNNIYLSNAGIAGESGQIKIGTTGTHANTTIAGQVAIPSTSDVSLTGDGALMLGLESGLNIAMDSNEMQARDNGSTALLSLNAEGGDVHVGKNDGSSGSIRIPWLTPSADVRTDSGSLLVAVVSSRRYKRNLEPFEDDYTKILELSPYTFEYLDQGRFPKGEFMGYMAEDLDEQGMPHLVRYDDEGRPMNINYDQMSVYMIELLKRHESALSAQGGQIEVQRREIEVQSDLNAALLERIAQLESRLRAAGEGSEH